MLAQRRGGRGAKCDRKTFLCDSLRLPGLLLPSGNRHSRGLLLPKDRPWATHAHDIAAPAARPHLTGAKGNSELRTKNSALAAQFPLTNSHCFPHQLPAHQLQSPRARPRRQRQIRCPKINRRPPNQSSRRHVPLPFSVTSLDQLCPAGLWPTASPNVYNPGPGGP